MTHVSQQSTPWRRVFERFGMSQAQLAKEIGRHRSKISRALRDNDGLINGDDQRRIIEASRRLGIRIEPADLYPFSEAERCQRQSDI